MMGAALYTVFDPWIGLSNTIPQEELVLPTDRIYPGVAEVAGLYADRAFNMLDIDALASHFGYRVHQFVY